MLDYINSKMIQARSDVRNNQLIVEATMDVEDILPGSEEEIDEEIDSDSIPDEVYSKVDKALDDLIDKEDYDDTEVEELVDDDDDEDITEIEAVITEAAGSYLY